VLVSALRTWWSWRQHGLLLPIATGEFLDQFTAQVLARLLVNHAGVESEKKEGKV
jgi:hypothetical protein